MRIGVIDYGAGNLFSLHSALEYLGHHVVVVRKGEFLDEVDHLVLPGVGAFGAGMAQLEARNLAVPIREYASNGGPLLGICLGAQLMLNRGHEFGTHEGLSLVAGEVRSIVAGARPAPTIGWAPLRWHSEGFTEFHGDWMYFVHAFTMVPQDEATILATRELEDTAYAAAIQQDSVVGLQFHPEKSGIRGLQLLDAILKRKS